MGGNRWAGVTVRDRFDAKVRVAEDGCLVWTGGKTTTGYGVFHVDGRKVMAHRAAYEMFVGEIPEGHQIDHLCRNVSCVNPFHLEPVTQRENLMRGNGWAGRNGRKTHCPKGHYYTAENTYVSRAGQRHCRECHRVRELARKRKLYEHLDVSDARLDVLLLDLSPAEA